MNLKMNLNEISVKIMKLRNQNRSLEKRKVMIKENFQKKIKNK